MCGLSITKANFTITMCKSAAQNHTIFPSESRIQEKTTFKNTYIFSPYPGVQEYIKEEQPIFAVLTVAIRISFSCINMLYDLIHPVHHVLLWLCH